MLNHVVLQIVLSSFLFNCLVYQIQRTTDFMAEDGETVFTPAARYYVDECTKDKLVLRRIEVNVDGPNLLENEVTFKKMGLYTK